MAGPRSQTTVIEIEDKSSRVYFLTACHLQLLAGIGSSVLRDSMET